MSYRLHADGVDVVALRSRARSAGADGGGGPAMLRPVARSKYALVTRAMQDCLHRARGITAQDRCVHFWLVREQRLRIARRISRQRILRLRIARTSSAAADGQVAARDAIRSAGRRGAALPHQVVGRDPRLAGANAPLVRTRNFAKSRRATYWSSRRVDREILAPGAAAIRRSGVRPARPVDVCRDVAASCRSALGAGDVRIGASCGASLRPPHPRMDRYVVDTTFKRTPRRAGARPSPPSRR